MIRNMLKIGCVVAIFFAGYCTYGFFYSKDIEKKCISKTHSYTNPELDCMNTEEVFESIQNVETKVKNNITAAIQDKKVKRVSVFYRDLNTRRWFGINQSDLYTPGSILKLPLAIAYYKLAEINPDLLSREGVFVPVGESLNVGEHFKSSQMLIPKTTYSLETLIDRMLVNSDNDAAKILVENIDEKFHDKVLLDLGINLPTSVNGAINLDFFSAATYAAILRSLYNSSYLNVEHSEKVLSIMSRSDFKQGLAAGIPQDVHIARKFGEVSAIDSETREVFRTELHDCGIIYRPNKPYILCIMTDGYSFEDLSDIIAGISNIVWKNEL